MKLTVRAFAVPNDISSSRNCSGRASRAHDDQIAKLTGMAPAMDVLLFEHRLRLLRSLAEGGVVLDKIEISAELSTSVKNYILEVPPRGSSRTSH